MKKLLLILNPCSGKKKACRALAGIVNIFNRGGYDVTVYTTACRGDATRVVAERAPEFDLVVCAGGDGTLNEVISGIIRGDCRTPLGYIPSGSTNDFAACHGISSDMLEAARSIVGGRPKRIDIGKFGEQYFSYVAAFGAFSWLSYTTPQNLKNALGHFAYLLAGVKELASIRSKHLRFTTADGAVYEDDYIFGAISNSTSVAGVLTLSSDIVDLNDGLFELMLIRKPHSLLELNDCVLALTTQDYHTPMLTFVSSSRVEIEAPADMDWTLDGERAEGSAHCVVENVHDAIQVILNAHEDTV